MIPRGPPFEMPLVMEAPALYLPKNRLLMGPRRLFILVLKVYIKTIKLLVCMHLCVLDGCDVIHLREQVQSISTA